MSDQRDETHIEQHGDGDVNVTPPEPETPAEGGDSGGEDSGDGSSEE